MFSRNSIRSQLHVGVLALLGIVLVMTLAGLAGAWKFRELTKAIRGRTNELPLAARLSLAIDDLRAELMIQRPQAIVGWPSVSEDICCVGLRSKFHNVRVALDDYKAQLQQTESDRLSINDISAELEAVVEIEKNLEAIDGLLANQSYFFNTAALLPQLDEHLRAMRMETNRLPELMKQRMDEFSRNARTEYYSWIVLIGVSFTLANFLLFLLYRRFNDRVFERLERLVQGSRRVAAGDYDFRIEIDANDEVAELAGALNEMTQNFQRIKDDLNQQVKVRTKEVVRSEKMASVGFLAAGVAHEINNPLASIAWSAESLETRIHEILEPVGNLDDPEFQTQIDDMQKYLRRIQDEAFRCKEITSALLDFSRIGEPRKVPSRLYELIQTVIEIVQPLSKYRDRDIEFDGDINVEAEVNPQEFKQVMMNLITNALNSTEAGGRVWIHLSADQQQAVITVRDDGCGMNDETLEQLFEPFYTRSRTGEGTGLGLSITYQIIRDHNGQIVPYSEGVNRGSTFTVLLPLKAHESKENLKAAA